MTTSDTQEIEKNPVSDFFGFSDMDDEEKVELLDSIGTTIFESALVRYAADASEDELGVFTQYLDQHQDEEDAFEQLAVQFPTFATLIFEEAQTFRTEAMQFAQATTALSTE